MITAQEARHMSSNGNYEHQHKLALNLLSNKISKRIKENASKNKYYAIIDLFDDNDNAPGDSVLIKSLRPTLEKRGFKISHDLVYDRITLRWDR